MQHAEAHERLSDLALEPARLARLEGDPSPPAAELRDHIAACPVCAAELASWRRTWDEIGAALPHGEPLVPLRPPAGLRARILEAAADDARSVAGPRRLGSGPRRADGSGARRRGLRRQLPWLVAAAAVLVAVIAGGLSALRTHDLDVASTQAIDLRAQVGRLEARNAELSGVAAAFERILTTPRHWSLALRAADGTASGTLAWTSQDIVVVTTGLPAPASDQSYRCWVEERGGRTALGAMEFSDGTGYWAGSMAPWAEASWAREAVPGVRFGVSLVPMGGQGTPVLLGAL